MPNSLGWDQIALRFALAVLAGFVVGLDRGERGQAAGLRTTILVCAAAAVAMIQANLLLAHTANAEGHTVVLDIMRLPLGILSGIGFIGAGAILRRGHMVHGVTTAATMWMVTVIGLCFGGGQIGLGLCATGVAVVALWLLKYLEPYLIPGRHGTLSLEFADIDADEAQFSDVLRKAGFHIRSRQLSKRVAERATRFQANLEYRAARGHYPPADLLRSLRAMPGLAAAEWTDSEL